MSENLFKLWTTQYSTNIELLLQQKGSKLRGKVREGFHVGKQASPVNQIGAVALQAVAGRFAPMARVDADMKRRWVFPKDGELPQLVDKFDELRTIVDPKSMYATNAANAVGRAWDDELIRAAFATAQLGNDGADFAGNTETFDTAAFRISDTFHSTSSSGLIVDKMIEAKRILTHYHNDLDEDPPTWITSSQGEADLLGQVQFVSTEFNDRPVLVDGKVKRFMGFDIVVMERLPSVTSNTIRQNIVFVKSGLYLGIWQDMQNDISQRKDLSGLPWQIYTSVSYGATRLQPGKVLQVLCADTTGADITP